MHAIDYRIKEKGKMYEVKIFHLMNHEYAPIFVLKNKFGTHSSSNPSWINEDSNHQPLNNLANPPKWLNHAPKIHIKTHFP